MVGNVVQCDVLYRIVARAITNRLRLILHEVVDEFQSAFIPGRLITDNVILGFECMHWIQNHRASSRGYATLKLDMSKVYDRVEWKFLEAIMQKLGFASKWMVSILEEATVNSIISVGGWNKQRIQEIFGGSYDYIADAILKMAAPYVLHEDNRFWRYEDKGRYSTFREMTYRTNIGNEITGTSETNWTRPPDGYYRIDVDACYNKGGNKYATGGIIRDSEGHLIKVFGRCWDYFESVMDGELYAIMDGLVVTKNANIKSGLIYSDSFMAVQAVMATQEDLSHRGFVIQYIQIMLQEVGATKISHVRRIVNIVAHRLANFAVFSFTSFDWASENVPSWVNEIVIVDNSLI
ncbi:hypothetical protein DH2020_015640 [Rehmannia glutinosa]|uniref:Reverse transcriptase n=1 Tax=Rehmannia glutinosa TaxID=99300 RepID=A0ABR0WUV4_REHGL